MSEWRDIETAPKDRTAILLLMGETIPDLPDIRVGAYAGGSEAEELGYREFAKYGGWMIWNTDNDWFLIDITDASHWMPLPPEPKHG